MMALIWGLIGGLIYRVRGMAHPWKKYVGRPITQIAFSLPFAYAAYLSGGLWVGIIVLVLTTLAVLTGRGNFFLGSDFKDPYEPETVEFIIIKLKNILPRYWYKCLGMALVGLCATLPCGIATLNPLIALSGLLMAPAYMLGRLIYNISPKVGKKDSSGNGYLGVSYLPRHLDYATEMGEFLTGFLLWSVLWLLA